MKTYKNYRWQAYDDKNWLLEREVETTVTKDTEMFKKGDVTTKWKFVGYFPTIENVLLRVANRVGLNSYDKDILKELAELREFVGGINCGK